MIPEIEPSTPLTFSASFFNSETSSLSSGEVEEEEIREGDIGEMDTGMIGRGRDGFSSDSSCGGQGSDNGSVSERTGRDSLDERESLRRAYYETRGMGSREELDRGESERATIQVVCE